MAKALGLQLDLPYLARIFLEEIDAELLKRVPINFAKQAQHPAAVREGDDGGAWRWRIRWTPPCWTTRACCWVRT